MQTSKELINNMMSKGPIDRVGLFEGFWPETLEKWVTQGYPVQTEEQNGKSVTIPEDPFIYFNFDLHKTGGFFDTEPKFGSETIIEETEDWKVVVNGAGSALKWWKNKSGTPEHISFDMASRSVWESEYRPHLLSFNPNRYNCKWWNGDNNLRDDYEDLNYAKGHSKWAFYGHVFIVEIMRNMLGDISLYENLLLDPDWIHDICQVYTNFFKVYFNYLFKQNGLPDGIWLFEDIAYKNGLFASPKCYSDLIFPYYNEIVQFFEEFGLPVIFHSDGKIDQAIPLIIDAGYKGLNPMEAKAGCNLFEYAEKYHEDLIFIGGFDVRILETNDHDLIRNEVRKLINGMKSRKARYIFGSDHTITPNVDFDSYLVALDIYQENMMY